MDGHGRLAHDTNVERGDHSGMFWAAAIKQAAYDQETISMLSSVLERAVAALPLKQRTDERKARLGRQGRARPHSTLRDSSGRWALGTHHWGNAPNFPASLAQALDPTSGSPRGPAGGGRTESNRNEVPARRIDRVAERDEVSVTIVESGRCLRPRRRFQHSHFEYRATGLTSLRSP
jgi:hypothetical protein